MQLPLRKTIAQLIESRPYAPYQTELIFCGLHFVVVQADNSYRLSTTIDAFKTSKQFDSIQAIKEHIANSAYVLWLNMCTAFDIMQSIDSIAQLHAMIETLQAKCESLQNELNAKCQQQIYDKLIIGKQSHKVTRNTTRNVTKACVKQPEQAMSTDINNKHNDACVVTAKQIVIPQQVTDTVLVYEKCLLLYEHLLKEKLITNWRSKIRSETRIKTAYVLICRMKFCATYKDIAEVVQASDNVIATCFHKTMSITANVAPIARIANIDVQEVQAYLAALKRR